MAQGIRSRCKAASLVVLPKTLDPAACSWN